ncbi:hypothetical protein ACH4FX_33015 [Streptomyces sp. NPDC018019]|uniref:hypothetical protein n=1 Tax=Streptomyces sp. NPDC018019 TaxID=3365030 RepID=UPI00379185A6
MSAIVRKLSDATYPGFEEFKAYFQSCAGAFPDFNDAVLVKNDTMIQFNGGAKAVTDVLNKPEFRHLWTLLPAGMDAFTAFAQLHVLNHAEVLGLGDTTGTYTIKVHSFPRILEHQNEAQLTQDHRVHLEAVGDSEYIDVTVCL